MKRNFLRMAMMLLVFGACGEVDLNDPIGSKEVPAQVTNIRVKNISGASIIYYDRPDDKNLKYVRAVYRTDDGIEMDATASFYTDSLLIEGFGAAGAYEVKLYSVSTGEAKSAGVPVTVNPLDPPYITAYRDLEIYPSFAGIRINTQNETAAKLSIATYKKNAGGEWEEIGMHYTVAKNVAFNVRGQDTVLTEFGVRVRDRWGHWSEVKTRSTIPWYEAKCDKTLFREVTVLGSDTRVQHTWGGSNTAFANLWDETWGNEAKCFHTRPIDPMPQHITIDLGKTYTLSRMLIWGRGAGSGNNYQFKSGYPMRVQLYGSTETESIANLADDIEDPSWILLKDQFLLRADGTLDSKDARALTEEDLLILANGQEVEFPSDLPQVRFFRFRTVSTYGSVNTVMLDEFSFFGSDK